MKKIFLFVIFAFSFIISTAQTFTPFNWQYPQYGAHALNCTRWITGQKFIAIGDAGTILLSNNDGVTWQRVAPFTEQKFRNIFIKDSLTFFAIASHDNGLGEMYKTIDAGVTWNLIYANANMSFRDIHFANDSVGYIVSYYSKVAKTTDGGNTWSDITASGSLSGNLTSVYFLNSDTGFVGKTSTTAAMYKTTNGGLTWSQVFGYSGQACYKIKFLNDTLAYAGAYNSRIYRTTNAGATWMQQTTFNTNEEVTSIDFSDLTHGVAVTDSYIYRTSNGTTWIGPFVGGYNHISGAFSPSGTIIVGDSHGGLKKAANFATTYNNVNAQSGLQVFRRIKFTDSQNGWVVGDGYNVLKTNNAGTIWTNTNTANYIDEANDFAAISATKIIIATGEGKVVTTSNGGTSFSEQILSTNNSLNAISFPSSTNGYVVGDNGVAFKTTNGGTTYTPINTGITVNHTEAFFVTNQLGFVVSEYGEIKKTIDNANTWATLSTSGMGTTKQIYFTDIANGYTVNEWGAVFRTTDGGNSFIAAGQTCLQTPFDMQFINDSTGFVVGSFVNASCDISYTTNYGATWQSIKLPYEYAAWGIFALDTANVYIVGQNQSIIKTGSGSIITNLHKPSQAPYLFVFPNPINDLLNISINSTFITPHLSLKIIDILGKEVMTELILNQNFSLNVQHLKSGIYFIRIGNEIVKFVKA